MKKFIQKSLIMLITLALAFNGTVGFVFAEGGDCTINGHTLVKTESKDATCTENGNNEYWVCSVCSEVFSDGEGTTSTTIEDQTISATGHDYNATYVWSEYEACIAYVTCSNDSTHSFTLAAAVSVKEKAASTCTQTGFITYQAVFSDTTEICETQEKVKTLEFAEHSYEGVVTDSTCTDKGYTTYICSVCGASYKGDETKALGHSYEVVVLEPTCKEEGYTIYTCTVCGDNYTSDTVSAKGHTPVVDPEVLATCTEAGLTEGSHCLVCSEVLEAQETVAAKGHTTGAAVKENIVDEACTKAGSYNSVMYCLACGVKVSSSVAFVAALGHSYEWKYYKSSGAVCTASSSWVKANYICLRCGKISASYRVGQTFISSEFRYKVLSAKSKTVTVTGLSSSGKNKVILEIPAIVSYGDWSFKVTAIANNAFKNNKKFQYFTIGKNVKTIGNNAFYNCKKLIKILGCAGLATIGKKTFMNCKKMTYFQTTSKSLKKSKVGDNAFKNVSGVLFKVSKFKKSAYKKIFKAKGAKKFTVR